jgi:L-iditol 2-dehydrogenase
MSYSAPYPGREWSLTAHYFATGQMRFAPEFIYKKLPLSAVSEAFQMFHHPEDIHGKVMLMGDDTL